jgi:hypothetical protein
MRSAGIICILLFSSVLTAGCFQLPGIHSISDTPDPVIGQWIGGEPPETDMHVVFYENQTFYSMIFSLSRGEATETGTWLKIERGQYSTQSVSGEITNWTYDSWEDTVSVSNIPQRKYYRYKG